MRTRGRRSPRGLLPAALALAGLALGHSVRVRGFSHTLLFSALGLGTGAAGEYLAVNVARTVRHHGRPQLLGVPVAAVLGWYTITYAAFAIVESLVCRATAPVGWPWSVPIGSAALATSLDLLLDCYGLDRGLWEWRGGGPYASEVVGPNGRHGIPITNFVAWFGITGGVSLAYLVGTGQLNAPRTSMRPAGAAPSGRAAALLLLPYYALAADWALACGRRRYLLYSVLVPALLACGVASPVRLPGKAG